MISVEQARGRILEAMRSTPAEVVALADAWNRVTATAVTARLTQPPADVSAMDGYALRATDGALGARLKVIGTAPPGAHPFDGHGPGGRARSASGFVPPATKILYRKMQHAKACQGSTRRGPPAATSAAPARTAAGDLSDPQAGGSPPRRGLAAAANYPWLTVHRYPRIAILATGDEIAMPGEPIPPGGIVSSNSHALAALVRAAGAEPIVLPVARDEHAAISAVADSLFGVDLLVTTGGASVGDHDLVIEALKARGMTLDFWQIAMRPGKPLLFGQLGATPVLGLPGNPVSAMVCGILFLLPSLARLSGLPAAPPPISTALLGAAVGRTTSADHLRASNPHGRNQPHRRHPFAVRIPRCSAV